MGTACLAAVVAAAAAQAAAQTTEPTLVLDLGAGVRLELVLVKGGTFKQGSPANEVGRAEDETLRDVALTRDFYMGKFPVTVGQFRRFVEESGYRTEAEKGTSGGFGFDSKALVQRPEFNWRNPGFPQTDEHPVVLVTYDDAIAFTQWIGGRTRRAVSLPTEAEWEYACRAGSASRFHAGDSEDEARTIAWFKANAGNGTRPVGQKRPNALGLHDMSGNVYEWCRDWYGPYAPGPIANPEETRSTLSDRPRRVLRGGSWLKDVRHVRSAARYRNTPGSRNADNGFRIVAAAEPPAPPAAETPAAGSRPAAEAAQAPEALWLVVAVLMFGAPIALVGLVIYLAVRRSRSRGIAMRAGTDGVYFRVPRRHWGSTVRYRCRVDGREQEGSFVAEPGQAEQFVYTGGRPSDLAIVGVLAAAGAAAAASRALHERRDDDTSEPFRGYPSAY